MVGSNGIEPSTKYLYIFLRKYISFRLASFLFALQTRFLRLLWWAQMDSNHRRIFIYFLAKIYMRSSRFVPFRPANSFPSFALVGSNGLEPSTSRLSGVCSNQLSYEPVSRKAFFTLVVEINGFEPLTPCLQGRCSSQLSYTPTPLFLSGFNLSLLSFLSLLALPFRFRSFPVRLTFKLLRFYPEHSLYVY